MSSGEAELYALVKAAAQTKYLMSLARDFGLEMKGKVNTDSTAAIGITQRSGLAGRTRHIHVQYLWIQQEVADKGLGLKKVDTKENLADILTKTIAAETLDRHLKSLNLSFAV